MINQLDLKTKPKPIWPISLVLLLISLIGIFNLIKMKEESINVLNHANGSANKVINVRR